MQIALFALTEDKEDDFTVWTQFKVFVWRVAEALLPGRFDPWEDFGLFVEDFDNGNRPWHAFWTAFFGLPALLVSVAWEQEELISGWKSPTRVCLVGLLLLIDFWMPVIVYESFVWEYIPAWEEWKDMRRIRRQERESQQLVADSM